MNTPSIDVLLTQRSLAVRVARAVLADAALAEDVAQQALLRLWRAERDGGPGLLATTVRRLALNARRGLARLHARERSAAAPAAATSPLRILELEEQRRRVVEAVLALAEPLVAVVLLRYFDDLPPRRIAARLGVPVETVRTRLKRAHELLRERLLPDGAPAERARSLTALALLPRGRSASAPAARALARRPAQLCAAGALVAGVAAVLALQESAPDPATAAMPASDAPPLAAAAPAIEPPRDAVAPARERAPAAAVAGDAAGMVEIRGRLVAAGGEPVAGGALWLLNPPDGAQRVVATSAADGGFAGRAELRIEQWNGEFRSPARLYATAPGGSPRLVEVAHDPGAPVLEVGDVELEPGGMVRGRVVDATGAGIAGAWVFVRRQLAVAPGTILVESNGEVHGAAFLLGMLSARDLGDRPNRATTASDGSFELGGLAPGRHEVYAVRGERFTIAPVEAEVSATAPGSPLRLELPPAAVDGFVEVRVLDEAGAPRGGAVVEHHTALDDVAIREPTLADADGRIRVAAWPGSTHDFAFDRGNGDWAWLRGVVPGAPPVDWRVGLALAISTTPPAIAAAPTGKGTAVRGVVRLAGAPVAGASITLAWVDPDSAACGRRARAFAGRVTAADGTFELIPHETQRGLPDAPLVVARAIGCADAMLERTAVEELAARGSLELALRAGGALEGAVVSRDGRPLGGLAIAASSRAGTMRVTHAAADGRFRFAALSAGPWCVAAFDRGFVPESAREFDPRAPWAEVAIEEGETTAVTLEERAGPRASLELRLSAAGFGLAGVNSELWSAPAADAPALLGRSAKPEGEGRLALRDLGAGRVRAIFTAVDDPATQARCSYATGDFPLEAGPNRRAFEVATGTLRGALRPPRPASVALAAEIADGLAFSATLTTDESGTFTVTGVPAATLRITIDGVEHSVEVRARATTDWQE